MCVKQDGPQSPAADGFPGAATVRERLDPVAAGSLTAIALYLLGPQRKRKSPIYIFTSIVAISLLAVMIGGVAILAAAVLLLMALFYPLFLSLWDRIYGAEDIADQVFYAHTEDGWNISMHFHRPENPKPGAYPVIVAHGIAANKYSVDMDRAHSIAYFLKQHGYPVFVINLRGVGKSYHQSRTRFRDFSFDNIVEQDVPAVIRTVRRLTGAPRVNWIGHSMGGMIMYGFLGRRLPGSEDVASFVALGSPGRIDHARRTLWGMITRYPWMNDILDFRFGAQVISPLSGRFGTPVEELIFSKENMSSLTIRRMMKNGVENISRGLARQFIQWIRTGSELSMDGSFNYREGLQNITAPTLFISGSRDHIAIPESVRYAYERAASPHKRYVELGRELGLPADYCHLGLSLGDRAVQEVFPLALEWLDEHGREHRKRGALAKFLRKLQKLQKKRDEKKHKGRRFRPSRDINRPSDVIQA
jgi:pimeloyl-ACP methyl ester carboxylesterase